MFGRIITLNLAIVAGLLAQQIDINTGTKGTLNINRGGCGATTASGCLINLGGIGATTTDTLTNKTLTSPRINAVLDVSNGSVVLQILSTTGATEGLAATPATVGNPVSLGTFGSGANVDMLLDPKGTGILRLPIADEISVADGTTGQFMRKAANGRMEWATISGTGTVTSVGLTGIASIVNVAGSPITTSGSFSLSLANQAQNSVFAGPTSGSGVPTFRSLVAADVPNLDAAKITSGVLSAARVSATVVNSRCLRIDGSGNIDVAAADCGTGGGSGITTINSQPGPAITLATGSAGTDFGISAGSNIVTFNLPTASSLNRGLLSTSDWTTFNNKVAGPGLATTVNYLAAWADTSGTLLGTGFPYSTSSSPNTIVMRDANSDMYTSWFRGNFVNTASAWFGQGGLGSAGAEVVKISQPNALPASFDLLVFKDFVGTGTLSKIDGSGNFTGRANTALALAADPANCVNAGEKPSGVAADGSAQGCSVPTVSGNGLDIYNVKSAPYNAVGDGSNDDTAEIQAAINACQDSTRGGVIYFPPGIYAISSGLTHGNGSSTGAGVASTKAVCSFEGAGAGDDAISSGSANVTVSAIKWTASNPGSLTYMLTIDGPMFGWGMRHLKLWANSNSNVVGLDARQINYFTMEDVSIVETGGGTSGGAFAMKIWPQKTFDHFACYGTMTNVRIRPYTNSVGSGLWVGGNSSVGTACSINVVGGYFNRDNNYTSGTNTATYALLLDSSDNFHAVFTHFNGTGGNGSRNGCTIGASPGAYSGAGAGVYPDSAHFYGISSSGMCGQTGTGRPFVVWGGECGADGQGSCDYHNAFTGGGTKPISLSGESGGELKGIGNLQVRYLGTNENYSTVNINHASGGQNGAGNVYFQRDGVNIGRIKSHYFDGLGIFVGDGGGTGTLNERLRLRNNGIMTPSEVTFADLGGEPTGSYAYCNNCRVTSGPSADNTVGNNTCTSGGSGALAVKINGAWRCFATQN